MEILLSHLGGLYSLTSQASLYFYNSIVLEDTDPHLSGIMYKFYLECLKQLEELSRLCLHIGIEPRLWEVCDDMYTYWSPGYNLYSSSTESMLTNAIRLEQQAIQQCEQHLNFIKDQAIHKILRQIMNLSINHIKTLKEHIT